MECFMPQTPASGCWFLTGPTAAGKTAVGVALARLVGAEIISMDSMALYQGMDIGTAKPGAEDRRAAPHHLIDLLQPQQQFSLAQYLEAAFQAVAAIRDSGREVLFVGGTPLYLKGLLRGIFRGPAADWELRRRLEEEARRNGPDWLYRRLAVVDPAAARRLHPNDTRRLVRAIEVFELTGQPISRLQRQFETGRAAEQCRVFVLDWPPEQLAARIDRRVQAMFDAGLVEEVRGLLAGSQPLSKTARQAVGYREVIEHLEGGPGLADTIELVKLHTRQLAKRQRTWFRSLGECRFLPVSEPIQAVELAGQIAAKPQAR
jgi:tRNA dimethylallyltransferase